MTRVMADACNPANLPTSGVDLLASYVDGSCAVQRDDPVRISSVATNAGNVGDCEPGNPPPSAWVIWARGRRAAGMDPTIYCADDSLGPFFQGFKRSDVLAAFQAAGEPLPHLWVALPGATAIPPGAVAVQHTLNVAPGYDLSLVADVWPGVDDMYEQSDRDRDNLMADNAQQTHDAMARVESAVGNLVLPGVAAVKAELDALKAEIEAGSSVDAPAAIARIEAALRQA